RRGLGALATEWVAAGQQAARASGGETGRETWQTSCHLASELREFLARVAPEVALTPCVRKVNRQPIGASGFTREGSAALSRCASTFISRTRWMRSAGA